MPFIKQNRRDMISKSKFDDLSDIKGVQPGDRCYVYYKEMIDKWGAKEGWTTVHNIYKDIILHRNSHETGSEYHDDDCILCDRIAAHELAWQVFFQLYVMPYELKKREENGG